MQEASQCFEPSRSRLYISIKNEIEETEKEEKTEHVKITVLTQNEGTLIDTSNNH